MTDADKSNSDSLPTPVTPRIHVSDGGQGQGHHLDASVVDQQETFTTTRQNGIRRASFNTTPSSGHLHVPASSRGTRRHSASGDLQSTTAVLVDQLTDSLDCAATLNADVTNKRQIPRLSLTDSIGSFHSNNSDDETQRSHVVSELSQSVSERVHDLVRRFVSRTERFKERAIQPPTPTSSNADAISGVSSAESPVARQHRLDSFMPPTNAAAAADSTSEELGPIVCGRWRLQKFFRVFHLSHSIDPNSNIYLCWLFLVTLVFLYNASAGPVRTAFARSPIYGAVGVQPNNSIGDQLSYTDNCIPRINNQSTDDYNQTIIVNDTNINSTAMPYCDQLPSSGIDGFQIVGYFPGYETPENRIYWWILDYVSDVIYIYDILFVRRKLRFINNGMLETDAKVIFRYYVSSIDFKLDILSLLPLDIFYLIPSVNYCSLLRLPRVLKIKTFWEFYDRLDQRVSSAHIVRVVRTLTYVFFLIHLETCGYFVISANLGIGTDEWVYDGTGIAYLHCMYLASKTATTIGNNANPVRQEEFMFMIFYWLLGIFVFAMLIGQIRDILQAADANRDRYRKTFDQTLYYMKSLNVPKELQERVRMWFTYNWEHSKTLDENSLLEALPKKMKTDLAIHVHFNTLSKVNLFQDCDKNLLYDLVLKLKPVLFLPGDYICRKGEVGTEMYIVMNGQVEVVGGPNNSLVFATLHEGSVFGEISLLALAGGNRRTADVRSKGFSQLFLLSKADFEEAMAEYPDVQKNLRKKAKKLLAQNKQQVARTVSLEADEVIKSRPGTPKLLRTVIQVVTEDSHIHDYLGTRRRSSNNYVSNRRPSVQPTQPQEALCSVTVHHPRDSITEEVNKLNIELNVQIPGSSHVEELEEVLIIKQTEIDLPLLPDVNMDNASKIRRSSDPQCHSPDSCAGTQFHDDNADRSPSESSMMGQPWSDSCSLASGLMSILDLPSHSDLDRPPSCPPYHPSSAVCHPATGRASTDNNSNVSSRSRSSFAALQTSSSSAKLDGSEHVATAPSAGHKFPLQPPSRTCIVACTDNTSLDVVNGRSSLISKHSNDATLLLAGRCSVDMLTGQRQYPPVDD